MATLTVTVTEDDIDKGKRDNARECPVALALRCLGYTAVVENYGVQIGRSRPPLPPAAVAFVEAFDSHKPVQPFAFDLELPEGPPEGPEDDEDDDLPPLCETP